MPSNLPILLKACCTMVADRGFACYPQSFVTISSDPGLIKEAGGCSRSARIWGRVRFEALDQRLPVKAMLSRLNRSLIKRVIPELKCL